MIRTYWITAILVFGCSFLFGQNSSDTCANAQALCLEDDFTYQNTSNSSSAEAGPNYGCLGIQLNPAWFVLQVAQGGDILFDMTQSTEPGGTPNLDIDFIAYGPFSEIENVCESQLTFDNIVVCSYTPGGSESVSITDTQNGDYFLLMITNFSNQPGYVTITQNSGSAALNCDLLSNNQPDFESASVHPNPVSNYLKINLNLPMADYKVFDTSGRVVLNGILNNNQIDVSHLPKGTFFLTLNNAEGKTLTYRFIK
ncbi:T9SS type A sorting domain-containing protein [Winogradskyella aurantiaca]|uniref:T9SS type A sorting domain-containing protein n=1 Tax=Winogradskyella aurantiaca TaxID=2219558 RepID=UPI000E1DD356|nr:T9SS type A sorting domain-containing protein [Winogradskyella aurantiaca]